MNSARHFHNDPSHILSSSLCSIPLINPSLLLDEVNKIIYRNPTLANSKRHVAVVSGGGSGHEPGYSGFVGSGLLAACICGTIFASPSADQIWKCLLYRISVNIDGILVVIMNYTGDVLNFGVGIEKARAMG